MQLRDVVLGEAAAEPPVERDHRPQQLGVQCLAGLGQLDAYRAPVAGVAVPGDQAVALHRVDVAGQRGPPMPTARASQLRAPPFALQRAEDQPDRHRAARFRQRPVECAADQLRGRRQLQADRRAVGTGHRL